MIFLNYEEALNCIHACGKFTLPAGLGRMNTLLEKLGDPQKELPVVHIAGTNGKGSTAAFCAAAFRAAGLKTGLFVSPFVLDFCERIQVDGKFIPREKLAALTEQVRGTGVTVNEFEMITAIGFLYFRSEKCDVVVLETGLGGRLDATNTATDLRVSVITKIGLDHTAVLGDTIQKITAEKCGIIKNSVTVTNPCQEPSVLEQIRRSSKELIVPDLSQLSAVRCDLLGNSFCYRGVPYTTNLGGEYQIENALTAIETVKASGFGVSAEELRKGLESAVFPARLEVLSRKPLVVLDGAHNPDGAGALVKAMRPYAGKIHAVVGMMRDKNVRGFLETVLPLCECVTAVPACDLPRAMPAAELAELSRTFCADVRVETDLARALSATKEPVFIFGSLYLASQVKQLQKDRKIPLI